MQKVPRNENKVIVLDNILNYSVEEAVASSLFYFLSACTI